MEYINLPRKERCVILKNELNYKIFKYLPSTKIQDNIILNDNIQNNIELLFIHDHIIKNVTVFYNKNKDFFKNIMPISILNDQQKYLHIIKIKKGWDHIDIGLQNIEIIVRFEIQLTINDQ